MAYNVTLSTLLTVPTENTLDYFTTTDEGSTLGRIHSWFTGFRITMLYLGLNAIILAIILAGSCRSGAMKAKAARDQKKQGQKEKEEYQLAQFQEEHKNADNEHTAVELALAPSAPQMPGSVHSAESHNASEPGSDRTNHIHAAASSLGKMKTAEVCCGAFISDIMNRSVIASAFLVHAWDQGSDLGVIYTWYTEDDGKWRYLAWISIGILLNYRLFSAYSLRKAQRGWRDTILQILDLQLFVDIFRSFEEVKPTDSLYWIRAMEAVLESCLQILLQFVYLYEETNPLVWLSLFGSLGSVIFALLHYTDVVFVFDTEILADNCWHAFWLKVKWYIAYGSRFLFRLCEVASRCMVLALIWSAWNDDDALSDIDRYRGAFIVGAIIGTELIFYALLTQMRIPPWEIAAFLVVNIDLTLTFEGREGALTKPLRHNPFYICICKPVAEMFTHISDETEQYYHARNKTDRRFRWMENENAQSKNARNHNPKRQKLLIAPAHYVYRFLESVFEIFCVLTYAVLYQEVADFLFDTKVWTIVLATLTTILTPILYCTVRAFADESKTLERNLIAMVHHGNDTHEIIQLIKAGASLKQTDYNQNSIVHACVLKNNTELLRHILKKYDKHNRSVHIDARNKKGYSPALLAAKCGSVDCLKALAKYVDFTQRLDYVEGIDYKVKNEHAKPQGPALIHIATQYDNHDVVEYLSHLPQDKCSLHCKYTHITENGAKIAGYNAIHVAARFNSVRVMDILIGKKVDFTARLANGDTAAIVAASRGHTIILQKLFNAGDIFDIRGNLGHTPLFRAALNRHPGTVLVLGRDFHADINIPDEHNDHIVTQCFIQRIYNVLSSLAELGCKFDGVAQHLEVEINEKGQKDDKLTPLMWACKYDYPKLVKTLMESGADMNHRNSLDETAAHHAAAMGSLDCLNLLHNYGANLELTNGAGQTPKDKAIQQHHKLIVEWFDAVKA